MLLTFYVYCSTTSRVSYRVRSIYDQTSKNGNIGACYSKQRAMTLRSDPSPVTGGRPPMLCVVVGGQQTSKDTARPRCQMRELT